MEGLDLYLERDDGARRGRGGGGGGVWAGWGRLRIVENEKEVIGKEESEAGG
jgi:hypothetical protein